MLPSDWFLPMLHCAQGFCNKIHKTLLKQLKYANVWGASAKHRPQKVGKEHGLVDEDIVQVRGWGVEGGFLRAGGGHERRDKLARVTDWRGGVGLRPPGGAL